MEAKIFSGQNVEKRDYPKKWGQLATLSGCYNTVCKGAGAGVQARDRSIAARLSL